MVILVLLDKVTGEVAEEVKKLKVLSLDKVTKDNYDIRIRQVEAGPKKLLVFERKEGGVREFDATAPETPKKIRDALFGEWKWRFVRGLNNTDRNGKIRVEFRVVPVNIKLLKNGKLDPNSDVARDDVKPVDNKLTLKAGDYVRFEVRNKSEISRAFVTILNLTASGAVRISCPDPGEVLRLDPGEDWKPLHDYIFRCTSYTGAVVEKDYFKAIATKEYTDFNAMVFEPARGRGAAEINRGAGGLRGKANHGLARLIGMAGLGEDPDPPQKVGPRPPQMRGERVGVEITDWSAASFELEVGMRD